MIDEKLLVKFKEKMDSGAENVNINDVLLVFELFKQISETDEDLKEELEAIDISLQLNISGFEENFWFRVSDGSISYGEGNIESPSFTFTTTMIISFGMLFGEIDATSAYMAGDITVEGNLQDAMTFQEIIELSLEVFEDRIEVLIEENTVKTNILNFDYLDNIIGIKLKNYTVSNFKSFKNMNFDLNKINIILGPNNSGKSNILRWFLLLKQTFTSSLESTLSLNGNIVNLGSFKDITYKSNLQEIIVKNKIEINFKSEKTQKIYQKEFYYETNYFFNDEDNAITLKQFEIKDLDNKNSIFKFSIDSDIVLLNNQTEEKIRTNFFNIREVLITNLKELYVKINKTEQELREEGREEEYDIFRSILPPQIILKKEIGNLENLDFDLSVNFRSFFPEIKIKIQDLRRLRSIIRRFEPRYLRHIKLKSLDGFIKNFSELNSSFIKTYEKFTKLTNLILNIRTFLKAIKRSLIYYYNNSFYIGPIRESPKRYYPIIDEIARDVGFKGEYTPQLLKMIKEKIQYEEFSDKINFWLKNFEMSTDVEIRKYKEIPELISIICKEYYSGVESNIKDMGIGTSQVLPIIIEGFLIEPNSVLIIEQPEIHLHPKAQSTLGDLLVEIAKENKTLIIETHSEHLIRRIQRKIAENEISNQDVFFYYINIGEDGSKLQKLELNEDGYIKKVPDGFFPKDYEDVFGHLMTLAIKKEKKND